MRAVSPLLALSAVALAALSCDPTPLASGARSGEVEGECSLCHGGEDNAAPPQSLSGAVDTSDIGVGAHQAHLRDGAIRKAIDCGNCHRVPDEVGQSEHMDLAPADILFSGLALASGQRPHWDRDTATCANTYCHGGSLHGGLHSTPVWTQVDGKQTSCKGCHGAPPPPPHPQMSNCWRCHDQTVNEDGSIKLDEGRHIDGQVQAKKECWDCHGSQETHGAPAPSLEGSEDPRDPGVGAHRSHVLGDRFSTGVPCESCHRVPTQVGDRGHIDGQAPAEVRFSALASSGDEPPSYAQGAERPVCTNVYCHGEAEHGASNLTPDWTRAGLDEITCGSCHSLPPPAPHPARDDCQICHPATAIDRDHVNLASGTHINGEEDVSLACNGCHGDSDSAAPPRSLYGKIATTEPEVGAHRAHVLGQNLRAPLTCSACHLTPRVWSDPGHIDASPAELVFGDLARAGGADPVYDGSGGAPTCSNVYCHGATLSGGQNTTPVWTQVDGSQRRCTSCHGAPPPLPHPQVSACENCHPQTVVTGQVLDISSGTHIDGELSFY